jgi:hypothetical protein
MKTTENIDDKSSQVGALRLGLTGIGTSGSEYRLRNAVFRITGTDSESFSSEDHLDELNVRLELPAGDI